MRFIALIKKELRQCLPWMLLAAIFFLVLGSIALREKTRPRNIRNQYPNYSSGANISNYQYNSDPDFVTYALYRPSPLDSVGGFLMLTSIGLGLAMGIQQFWMAGFRRTWGFTLHRSVTRQTLLFAKLAAALMIFIIAPGLIWTAFYKYASQPNILPLAPTSRVLADGWFYIALGFVFYLGTALAGLSNARWYTTKLLGLAFALFILITASAEWQLTMVLAIIIIGALILLAQIFSTFLNREF